MTTESNEPLRLGRIADEPVRIGFLSDPGIMFLADFESFCQEESVEVKSRFQSLSNSFKLVGWGVPESDSLNVLIQLVVDPILSQYCAAFAYEINTTGRIILGTDNWFLDHERERVLHEALMCRNSRRELVILDLNPGFYDVVVSRNFAWLEGSQTADLPFVKDHYVISLRPLRYPGVRPVRTSPPWTNLGW